MLFIVKVIFFRLATWSLYWLFLFRLVLRCFYLLQHYPKKLVLCIQKQHERLLSLLITCLIIMETRLSGPNITWPKPRLAVTGANLKQRDEIIKNMSMYYYYYFFSSVIKRKLWDHTSSNMPPWKRRGGGNCVIFNIFFDISFRSVSVYRPWSPPQTSY